MEIKSFFSNEGITSTSANYYCNMAKEAARKIKNALENVRFYSETVNVIGMPDGGTVSNGITADNLDTIKSGLDCIAKLNAFTAFMREAIKEKERLYKEASNWVDEKAEEEFRAKMNAHRMVEPDSPKYITEEDVKKGWTVGEQEKYLSLEAEAAAYGKYIHEDGCISAARIDLMNKIANPRSVSVNGRDTIFRNYTPTVSQEDVDDLFFNLQAHYREVQAELNGMKKRIQDAITEQKLKADEEYRSFYQVWSQEMKDLQREERDIVNREKIERTKRCEEVQKLKIVIPHRLKETFDYLSGLNE